MIEVTREKYQAMLNSNPLVVTTLGGFLVGGPVNYNEVGEPRYAHYHLDSEKFFFGDQPLTIAEFDLWACPQVAARLLETYPADAILQVAMKAGYDLTLDELAVFRRLEAAQIEHEDQRTVAAVLWMLGEGFTEGAIVKELEQGPPPAPVEAVPVSDTRACTHPPMMAYCNWCGQTGPDRLYHETAYSHLYLTVARRGEPIGAGYYYRVSANAIAHEAFHTRAAFVAWARELGLRPQPPNTAQPWDLEVQSPGD